MTSDKILLRLVIVLSVVAIGAVGLGVYVFTQLGPLADRTARNTGRTDQALMDFEGLSRAYAAKDMADKAQIRRTATANHTQALRSAGLAKRLAVVAKQRADDSGRSARVVAALAAENRRALLSLAADERHIAELQTAQKASTVATTRVICTKVDAVVTQIRTSVEASDKALGQPGTPGYAYYQLFPGELAKQHAFDRQTIAKFHSLRCPALTAHL